MRNLSISRMISSSGYQARLKNTIERFGPSSTFCRRVSLYTAVMSGGRSLRALYSMSSLISVISNPPRFSTILPRSSIIRALIPIGGFFPPCSLPVSSCMALRNQRLLSLINDCRSNFPFDHIRIRVVSRFCI